MIIFLFFFMFLYIILSFYNLQVTSKEHNHEERPPFTANILIAFAFWSDTFRTIMYPIRTDRILIRVTSASKRIFLPRVEEAHEFAPGYMSARRP